jgi:hypothetical protein
MKTLIGQAVYHILARDCDDAPMKPLDKLWMSCRHRLTESGLPPRLIDDFDYESHLRPYFRQRLVPNPYYWRKYFRSKVCFYLVRARSKRYLSLLSLLRQFLPDISFFVCYGELDVIVRIFGDDDLIEQVEAWLTTNGFPPSVIKTDRVVLFYDREVDPSQKLRKPTLESEVLDQALASPLDETPPHVVRELMECGVALGAVYFEDTHLTGRIRALMGIKFETLVPTRQLHRIEQALISVNDQEHRRRGSRPLSSIYRCGGHYAYLLEMIFDDQEQLDWVTDRIQELDPNIGDTETLILAKAHFAPVSYSERGRGKPGRYAVLRHMLDQTLIPLSQRLVDTLPELETTFVNAPPEYQFQAISLYRDLIEESHYPDADADAMLREYLLQFLRGVLESKVKTVQNAALGMIRDVVEARHRELIQTVLAEFFDEDEGELQKAFKAENALWEKWGLATWAHHRYPKWNRDSILSAVLTVPEDTLRSLALVGQIRNRLAHDAQVGSLAPLTQQVREVFRHSYLILSWLDTAKIAVRDPHVPLRVVKELASSGPEGEHFELLSAVRLTQQEMLELLNRVTDQADERWRTLASLLQSILSGVGKIDERTIRIVEEIVIPQIRERERSRAQRTLDYLRETAGTLPSEVVGNMLAGLIATALGLS